MSDVARLLDTAAPSVYYFATNRSWCVCAIYGGTERRARAFANVDANTRMH